MKTFNINAYKLAIILLLVIPALIISSCKKELVVSNTLSQKSSIQNGLTTGYILGIDKANGDIDLYRTTPYAGLLLYGGDILVYESDIEPIKIYKQGQPIDNAEIERLINRYKSNSYTKQASQYQNDSRVCIRQGASIWPSGIVRLGLDPLIPEHLYEKIMDAINLWKEKTNIGFEFIDYDEASVDNDSTYKLKVFVNKSSTGKEAQSTVGARLKKPSVMVLTESSNMLDIVHEFTHVFGFIHEHQRPSRDSYIKLQKKALITILPQVLDETNHLDFNNLEGTANRKGKYYSLIVQQFAKKEKVYNDDTTLAPFDIKSVMIYPSYHPDPHLKQILMQYNAPIYILTKPSGEIVGEPEITDINKFISEGDIKKVNTVYPL